MTEEKKENKHGFLKGCGCGCLSVIILSILIVVFAYGCSGGNNNSDSTGTTNTSTENSEVRDFISKANAFYAESGASIQAFSDLTNTDNYEENRQKLMDQTSDLQQRVKAELDKIPEDTDDPGLKVARQALDTDNNICLAIYATLATNDPSGADMITQYVQQYNDLKPELDKYMND